MFFSVSVDLLIGHEVRQPNKYADIPEQDIPTRLSDRGQRCAWQQACGLVQSWFSKERQNPPLLHNICLQANAQCGRGGRAIDRQGCAFQITPDEPRFAGWAVGL